MFKIIYNHIQRKVYYAKHIKVIKQYNHLIFIEYNNIMYLKTILNSFIALRFPVTSF